MSNSSVESLLFAALEKATEAERAAFLDSACGGDAELRRQVEKLLRAHAGVGDFLQKPVVEQLVSEPKPADATQALGAASTDWRHTQKRTQGDAASGDEDTDLDFLQPTTRPDSLGRLGHYEVMQVLGKGGFGIVFRAIDDMLQRVVALKVMAPQLAATSPARKRFLREARSSAQVRHENAVQVYEVAEQPLPYLAMEFIPGETLQQKLDRVGPLDVPEVLRIGRQIAEGLAAAHAMDLIHRDVKPGNVILEGGSQKVKITDFGLARTADDASISQSGIIAGTPMYMAPEQAEGQTFDQRADLFSLGSVLYVMVAGRPPFRANTTVAVLKRVAEDRPRAIREIIPETPQWLCDIITKLHAKDPADRYQSAREVADVLADCEAQLKVNSKLKDYSRIPRSKPQPSGPAPRLRRRRWVAAAAVLLLLLGGLGLTEATGVTNIRGTVIRLFSPEGTLVVEVDDPGVSVTIDGSDLVITGAGPQEIRLKTGRYRVEAMKNGKLVRRELVTITKNGKQVVRVSQEADVAAWEGVVAALPPAQQVKSVAARLQELNPGFDGKVEPTVEDGVVTGLAFSVEQVTDISPVRALTKLKKFGWGNGKLFDLSPLKGLKLAMLDVNNTRVSDLSPLAGMPLTSLNLNGCSQIKDLTPLKGMPLTILGIHDGPKVVDFSPLKGMPLTELWAAGNLVRDLSPLRALPLTTLCITHCPEVQDLSPLKGLSLTLLQVSETKVRDLEPLKDMPLKILFIDSLGITDLTPLQGMPLEDLRLTPKNITKGLDILRDMKSLKTIGLDYLQAWPAAEFWQRYGKGEFK